MTAGDVDAFAAVFAGLRAIFPLRADKGELQNIQRVYFTALARFPIAAVEAAADTWLSTGTRFPKPADWIGAIDRPSTGGGLLALDAIEAAEHRRALALHFEDDPCYCYSCQQAGVTHRLRRFLPLHDDRGVDLRGVLDGRPVTRGFWAHGAELAAYYAARDQYEALAQQVAPKVFHVKQVSG